MTEGVAKRRPAVRGTWTVRSAAPRCQAVGSPCPDRAGFRHCRWSAIRVRFSLSVASSGDGAHSSVGLVLRCCSVGVFRMLLEQGVLQTVCSLQVFRWLSSVFSSGVFCSAVFSSSVFSISVFSSSVFSSSLLFSTVLCGPVFCGPLFFGLLSYGLRFLASTRSLPSRFSVIRHIFELPFLFRDVFILYAAGTGLRRGDAGLCGNMQRDGAPR